MWERDELVYQDCYFSVLNTTLTLQISQPPLAPTPVLIPDPLTQTPQTFLSREPGIPGGQTVQSLSSLCRADEVPTSALKVFSGQSSQSDSESWSDAIVAASTRTLPAPQTMQSLRESWREESVPASEIKVPAAQTSHDRLPCETWYFPAPQTVQEDDPSVFEYVPDGRGKSSNVVSL